jgi:ketosteroid isomerase-like protein
VNDDERRFVMEVLARPQAAGSSVEERLAIHEDIEEIRDVVFKYAWYADHLEFDAMLDLYTEDVERILSGTRTERTVGRDELRQVLDRRAPERDAATGQLNVQRSHHIDTEVVKLSPDHSEAWVVALGQVVAVTADGQASHEDTYLFHLRKAHGLRRTHGRWRIARQVVVTDNARNPLLHPER